MEKTYIFTKMIYYYYLTLAHVSFCLLIKQRNLESSNQLQFNFPEQYKLYLL